MVDSAIICLENTHRHLGMGASSEEAAFLGASEVALPELVSTLCTFLVLAPLALMPGMGAFLFRPMAFAVAFAMISAYLLSRTLVPAFSALLLSPHAHHDEEAAPAGFFGRMFRRWEALIDRGIAIYCRGLDKVIRYRWQTIALGYALLIAVLLSYGSILRREFFPEVDSGAFEMILRGPSGMRIEKTEEFVAQAEQAIRDTIGEHDLQLIVSEIGVVADWSAAYTPNAGPMDSVLKVQLSPHRLHTAQHHVEQIRKALSDDDRFSQFEFGFDAGGMIRGALNEGKSNPISIRITGKNQEVAYQIASAMKQEVVKVDGVVDARILQR
jgi:multidrug efflux pump subunit AcrB